MSQAAHTADLTLGDALARAAASEPARAAGAAQLQVAQAGIAQADVRPRDTLGLDVEDFAGTGAYSPIDRSQTTAWFERTWERGGKREARIGSARSELGVAAQRNRVRMLDWLAQVQTAWIEASAAEAVVPIAEQRLAALRRSETEVKRRVSRALDPLFAAERAKTAVAQAEIALDQARSNARSTRASLAAYWGGSPDFQLDTRAFGRVGEQVGVGQPGTPDIDLLSAQNDAAGARLKLAEAGNVADPSARVGVRHFGQGNDVALIVGGSMPLGSRAANRGNVARAMAEQQAVEAEIALARIERMREADRLGAERAATISELARIDRDVLPSAERSVVLVESGYRRGGTAFTFLELVQAQHAVTEARARRIELLRRYHLAGARLDRLNGRHAAFIDSVENR
jgi:cobalt-zinc-cadmium efflux system outer membrane protein